MSMQFTKEQQKVIQLHHRNILVSAAAGSGKTAVLTERIVEMVSSGVIDIDRLLVVTFTSAAASEMRERIREAIAKRIEEQPENEHLQKQSTLIHNAQITTISSFCLYLIKNHFNDIGLEPGFRVADEGELKLLRQDVLKNFLEEKFKEGTEAFLDCIETYSSGSSEKVLEEYILRLYHFSISNPWPEEWLLGCIDSYKEKTWMPQLLIHVRQILFRAKEQLQEALLVCEQEDGPYMYAPLLEKEKELLEKMSRLETYEEFFVAIRTLRFERLPIKKDESVSSEKRELVKGMRNWMRDSIKGLEKDYFFAEISKIEEDIEASFAAIKQLVELTIHFSDLFAQKKRERNIIDFSDMEHMALEILLEKNEGIRKPTQTAQSYQDYFEEILIDEYQDSNLVQESILQSIAREHKGNNNRFMVGDVKQSIYKFRLARPELFMEKYETYDTKENDCQRIDLQKNFRSRKEIIDGVNFIFSNLMRKETGGITYDEGAALYLGADYKEAPQEQSVELLLVERESEKENEELSTKEAEAYAIAQKIKHMVGHFLVTDKESKELRVAKYSDIVILLRSNSGWDEEFKTIFTQEGIPAHITSKTGYFSAWEVQLVLNMLRVLDNPLQDIPLSTVLLSPMVGFSKEEMGLIKIKEQTSRKWYEKLKKYSENGEHELLKRKVKNFLERMNWMREKIPYTSIHELLQVLWKEWGIRHFVAAMPAGGQRIANLEMLLEKAVNFENTSYHGLFHFIRYIEQMEKYDVDFGEANIADENANTVRIMSIHKSKGLEFPICFVSSLAKQLNKMDIRKSLVIDMDYGIGADFIDFKKRTKTPTLRKNAIIRKMENDLLGEEIRVLYVALTRAKEKLIMTACVNKLEKKLQNAVMYGNRNEGNSYLEFILSEVRNHVALKQLLQEKDIIKPMLKEDETPFLEVSLVRECDLVKEKVKEELVRNLQKENLLQDNAMSKAESKLLDAIDERFSFVYPYQNISKLYTKTTVSELKKAQLEELLEGSNTLYEEEKIVPYLPKFMEAGESITGSVRGSAYHRVLELLDLKGLLFTQEEEKANFLEEGLTNFCKSGRLSVEYKDAINTKAIFGFLETSIAKRMISAEENGKLFKEQPFVMAITANRIKKEFPKEEWMLIQGIIDVYFEEEDGLVVLDYKTDKVTSVQELVERYSVQLNYYAEALEQLTSKTVKEKIIYSFALREEIVLR